MELFNLNFEKSQMTKANFTNFEKEFIAELVMKYSPILENRRNDAAMCREKNATWEVLAAEFNNFDPKITKRTAKQLKKCWENLKTRAKKASLGLKPDQPYNMEAVDSNGRCETIVDTQPQVADLIALQLKPISDILKPLDEDSEDSINTEADNSVGDATSLTSSSNVPVEPEVNHNSATISSPATTMATTTTIVTAPSIKTLVPILPKPGITMVTTTSAPIVPTPTITSALKNPLLRQSLAFNFQEKQLQDEEQRLKVQLLKRRLEMAEDEHSETMALLRSKRQYVELKTKKLLRETEETKHLD